MKGYGFLVTGFKRYFAYKAQVLAKVIASPAELIIMIIVWMSIFNYSGLSEIGGFSLSEMINYYIIIYIAGLMISDRSDTRLGANIQNGYLTIRLLNPLQIYQLYLNDEFGEKLGILLTQLIPIILVSVFFLGLNSSLINTLLFVVSGILAYFMIFFFNMTFGLLYFKVKEYRYTSRIKNMISGFLSGRILPLSVFPLWLSGLIKYLPFNYFLYAPANIFLGKYSLDLSLITLLIQFSWIILFYAIFKIGWFRALKEFEGVGV